MLLIIFIGHIIVLFFIIIHLLKLFICVLFLFHDLNFISGFYVHLVMIIGLRLLIGFVNGFSNICRFLMSNPEFFIIFRQLRPSFRGLLDLSCFSIPYVC